MKLYALFSALNINKWIVLKESKNKINPILIIQSGLFPEIIKTEKKSLNVIRILASTADVIIKEKYVLDKYTLRFIESSPA